LSGLLHLINDVLAIAFKSAAPEFLSIRLQNFSFSALLCPVECGAYSSGVNRKGNRFFLCDLCGSSRAGGKKNILSLICLTKPGPPVKQMV
jgi:hypothetical protein